MIDKEKNKLLHDINKELENNPKDFFNTLGGLHDSQIKVITVDIIKSTIQLYIDDLYSNFINLPEYIDVKNIYFNIKINNLDINLDRFNKEEIYIYDIEVNNDLLKIFISPSGYIKVTFEEIYFSSSTYSQMCNFK